MPTYRSLHLLEGVTGAYPRALYGATGGKVADGDRIRIALPGRRLDLLVDAAESERRRAARTGPPPRPVTGYLATYRRLVGGADRGARTDAPLAPQEVSGA